MNEIEHPFYSPYLILNSRIAQIMQAQRAISSDDGLFMQLCFYRCVSSIDVNMPFRDRYID
jgi:hypothetical protein